MKTESTLNLAQQKQVQKQIDLHQQCTKPFDFYPIELGDGNYLEKMSVYPGVLWPMSSRRLAAYLYRERHILRDKTVIDMGCGCGIQGITAALYGAKHVILTDVMEEAYQNTLENVKRFQVTSKCKVRCGDLFENVPESADVIIFCQPYFADKPDPMMPFTFGMLDEGDLIQRFLDEARSHVKERILMSHLDLAGDTNDPRVQAPRYGYSVEQYACERLTTGEQQGLFCVYELKMNP